MLQLLKEYWYLAAGAILLLLSLLHILLKYQKKKKEQQESYQKKLKNQVLNEAIKNSSVNHDMFRQKETQHPISFDAKGKSIELYKDGNTVLRLSITGKAKNDYVVNPEKHIFLGGQPGKNDILLEGEHIASQHLEVFRYEQQVYIRNLYPDWPAHLKRKGSQTVVGTRGICISTGDQISLGEYRIGVELLDYTGTIR
ncbi:MAG: hypothetical protein ACRDBO_11680 [Lachnospiraceae bacterium]